MVVLGLKISRNIGEFKIPCVNTEVRLSCIDNGIQDEQQGEPLAGFFRIK